MFFGGERVQDDALVPVLGCGNDHGIDIRPREHGAVVLGDLDGGVKLFGGSEMAVVQIGDGDHADARIGVEQPQVRAALNADSDESQIDLVIGGEGAA